MRFGSTAKALAKCMLKHYRISECGMDTYGKPVSQCLANLPIFLHDPHTRLPFLGRRTASNPLEVGWGDLPAYTASHAHARQSFEDWKQISKAGFMHVLCVAKGHSMAILTLDF